LPRFPAIAHVALTVSDLDRSRKWYQRLFGSDPVLDQDTGPFHQVVWSVSGGLVAINWFPDLHSSEPFDERRPGLGHLSFACSCQSELEAWERRLDELDVPNGGASSTPATAQCCRFATRTTSLWSSSSPWARRAPGESVLRRPQSAADGQSNLNGRQTYGRVRMRAHSDTSHSFGHAPIRSALRARPGRLAL
jgi:glyoxylase I family protein